jgi:hypothetical protein
VQHAVSIRRGADVWAETPDQVMVMPPSTASVWPVM